jgi:hypothetical protein
MLRFLSGPKDNTDLITARRTVRCAGLFRPLFRHASFACGVGVGRRRVISRFGLIVLFCLLASSGLLQAASFTASLDRDTLTIGESATLTLSFEGGDPKGIPAPPAIPNLRVATGGNSRNVSIVNGQVSSTISQNFILSPAQPGEYTIPPLTAQVGNETLTTQPLKLTAVKAAPAPTPSPGTPAADSFAFLKLVVPKKELFVGEVETVELQSFVRDNLYNAENILQWCGSPNGPSLKAEGFTVIKTGHARPRRAQAGNVSYVFATLVAAISPAKAGPLKISASDAQISVQIVLPNQRSRDPVAAFFGGSAVEEKPVSLAAEPETINVLPLPRENVPPDFNGAVGTFTMNVTAGPTNVATGDPITVRVQLTGRGVLDALTLPEQAAWRDFKTFPATSKVESTDPLGIQGSKTFEQVILPQSTEIKALPPVTFSYFDPEQKAYRTLTQPAIPLTVRPGGSAPAPTVLASRPTQDNPPPSQDIVPIKERAGTLAQISPPLLRQPWFIAVQGLPLLAFVSALVWRRRTEALANNPRLRRQRQVAQIVREGLGQLRQQAAANQSEAFFATLVRLLQEQLGERLNLPASAITEAVIEENLRPRGVPETTLAPLREIFQTCNFVRYAPIKTSQELAALIPKLESVLRSLQEVKA